MTLILSNEDIDKLITMPECIDALEEAYVELAEGRAPRWAPARDGEISVQLAVQVGLDRLIEVLRGFGVQSQIPRHISISLGTPSGSNSSRRSSASIA